MSTPLQTWIIEQISETGPVPFARFMEWALYHPEFGYYTSGRVRVGHEDSDFTTAPHVSGVFAGCLARCITVVDAVLESPTQFSLVEGGPGEGRLARDLLDALARREPGLYRRTRYYLDEISSALRGRQRELLAPHAEKIHWGLPTSPVNGVYLSNELLDAFPVHRLLLRNSEVLEIWIEVRADELRETLRPPADPELAAAATALLNGDGYLVEVCPGIRPWLEAAFGCLQRGVVLTIDYGDEAQRLFGSHRPGGTCVGYRQHRQTVDLLAEPGGRDLTAQVDFTALRRAGDALGLRCGPLLKQREFLFAAGLLSELEEIERSSLSELEKLEIRRSVAPLLMPGEGMGESFKVLVQAKGVDLRLLPLVAGPGLGAP